VPFVFPLVYSTLGCPNWTLEQAADAAVANGYAGLEIRLLDGEIIPAALSPAQRAEVRQIMQGRGLRIAGLGASTRFTSQDADERRANVMELRNYLQLANALEAPMVRTFGGHIPEGATFDQAVDWVAEGISAVIPDAERYGVAVMLETHDAFCRGADAARVLAQVEHPRFQVIWDVHHPYRMGESIEETWRQVGERVGHVHLKDARRRDDGSWQLVLMGNGEVPNRAVINLLRMHGYQGDLSIEWEKKWHPDIEEPEIALPQHAQVVRNWMATDASTAPRPELAARQ
jgi:sugar phosphate isomerase/epimerase